MATSTRAAGRQHRWISLTEQTGIVLSEPVLADIAAAGFPQFDKKKLARFHKAREIWNLPPGMTQGDPQAIWISFILEEVLEIPPSYWLQGAEIPAHFVVSLTHQREVLRPSRVLKDGKEAIMLFLQVPRHQSLDSPWAEDGAWKASPTTKLERLLRETGVEVGLVTNGESWRLITASPSETASWLTWTAQTWGESPSTLSAFAELLGSARFFAGPKDGTILELVRRSRKRQADVADKLGKQAREALEVFIRALDIADNELDGKLLDEYSLDEIFEASAVFLMRLLFLLKAEESGLLPHGNVNYDRAYGVLHLLIDLENRGRISPEKLFGSYEAYAQLLSTFRLIHDGCVDSDINVTAYGGRLFDPMEFPLLEGRKRSGMWAVPEAPTSPKISDAVIREVLRSLKYARSDDGLVQLVSYQTLEVEQIGHMYEGLLELKLIRAPSHSQLLLLLPCEKEPFPTIEADALLGLSIDELIRSLSSAMSRPPASIATALEKSADRVHSPKLQFTGTSLDQRLDPVLRFVRNNGVVRPNGLYIHSGNRRHDQGAVYTPPTITEPMVRRALQPLLRRIDGKTRNPVLSASPQEILRIRVCDPAMGSGAFLVQAIRYLSECLVEAWDASSTNSPGVILTMPLAKPSDGSADELLLPESREERLTWARRFVAETCVYGVDVNPLAIEMGKLSIWLTTLARNKAFTFVDHALRLGNSVLGLDLQQLVRWHLDEDAPDSAEASKVIRKLILEAAEPRYELARLAGRSTERKKRELLKKAGAASLKLGISADLLTSAWLTDGTK